MIEEIIIEIQKLLLGKEAILIAIDGLGGAGKTTLAEIIQKRLNNTVIIQLDDFYSPVLKGADLQRLKEQVILPIYNNRVTKYQVYDWKTETLSDWLILNPKGVIILEGVYALHKGIREYYDVKIWIDYPVDLGFHRGISRDINRDGVDNTEKWKNDWMPLEAKYKLEQLPDKAADFIIDGANITNG